MNRNKVEVGTPNTEECQELLNYMKEMGSRKDPKLKIY